MISDILFESVNRIEDYLVEGGCGEPSDPLRVAIANLQDHMEAVRRIPGGHIPYVSDETTARYLEALQARWPGIPTEAG